MKVIRALLSTWLLVFSVGAVINNSAKLLAATPDCTPPPAGLVAWWPGEGNAQDIAGGNNGIVSTGLSYTNGEIGQAFLLNNTNAYFHVLASSNLNVGLGSGFTIETWIKPANVNGLHPILEWNQDGVGGIGVQFWIGQTPSSQGVLCAFMLDTNGNNYLQVPSPNGTLVANTWQHVALTYDRTTHMITLYVDGTVVAQSGWNGDVPQTSYNLWIGMRPGGCGGGCWTDGTFLSGPLDDLSLYNRALSQTEIAAIYAARGTGKCPLPPKVISVTPTNYYVNEGATVAYTVTAAGSPTLTYQWQRDGSDIPEATNSTLTLSNVVYSQAGNYDVVVSGPGGWVVSSNVVLRVNRAPIADASATEPLAISPNATNAVVVLDGSKSSDPDGDALTYAWLHTGDTSPFASGVVAMQTLPLGTNQLTLNVNDGLASASQAFAVEVITTSQAVDRLAALAQSGSGNIKPLVASLEAALAAIDRTHPQTAINQLEAFINKVQAQLEPSDPALAAQLIADAQAIIDALNGGTLLPAAQEQMAITSITHGHNGQPHLKIKGANGHIHVVETSTNMVDWVPVGVATQNSDGTYEFDDTQSQETGARFYRVVTPQ